MQTLETLDDDSLLRLCYTNDKINEQCKRNDEFWISRLVKTFGDDVLKYKSSSYRDLFLKLIYYTDKYTDNIAIFVAIENGDKDIVNFYIDRIIPSESLKYKLMLKALEKENVDLIKYFIELGWASNLSSIQKCKLHRLSKRFKNDISLEMSTIENLFECNEITIKNKKSIKLDRDYEDADKPKLKGKGESKLHFDWQDISKENQPYVRTCLEHILSSKNIWNTDDYEKYTLAEVEKLERNSIRTREIEKLQRKKKVEILDEQSKEEIFSKYGDFEPIDDELNNALRVCYLMVLLPEATGSRYKPSPKELNVIKIYRNKAKEMQRINKQLTLSNIQTDE